MTQISIVEMRDDFFSACFRTGNLRDLETYLHMEQDLS